MFCYLITPVEKKKKNLFLLNVIRKLKTYYNLKEEHQ